MSRFIDGIVDRRGYLALLVSQPCPYAGEMKRCRLRAMRNLFLGCSVREIEEHLSPFDEQMIRETLGRHLACPNAL